MSLKIPIVVSDAIPKGEVWMIPPSEVTTFFGPHRSVMIRVEWDISKIVRAVNIRSER